MRATIFEMGARDGLQNEHAVISTGDKVRFINLLSETGLQWIEATSFVSPKAIPQLADAGEVFRAHRQSAWRSVSGARSEYERATSARGAPGRMRSPSSPRPPNASRSVTST